MRWLRPTPTATLCRGWALRAGSSKSKPQVCKCAVDMVHTQGRRGACTVWMWGMCGVDVVRARCGCGVVQCGCGVCAVWMWCVCGADVDVGHALQISSYGLHILVPCTSNLVLFTTNHGPHDRHPVVRVSEFIIHVHRTQFDVKQESCQICQRPIPIAVQHKIAQEKAPTEGGGGALDKVGVAQRAMEVCLVEKRQNSTIRGTD